jgi:hypothetical protein
MVTLSEESSETLSTSGFLSYKKMTAGTFTEKPQILLKRKQSSPATRHGGAWKERKYSSYSFSTSALDGVSGQLHAPAALFPGKRTPGTHCTGGWVGLRACLDTEARAKILCPCRGSNPDRRIVQSVVRHYADWATPVPQILLHKSKRSQEMFHFTSTFNQYET